MKVTFKTSRGRKIVSLEVGETVDSLRQHFRRSQGVRIERQRFTLPKSEPKAPTVVLKEGTLESYGLKEGSEIIFKNLGPQIGWQTVFVIEYFGPLVLYPLFYFRPEFIYGKGAPLFAHSNAQLAGLAAWTLHFAKREYETLFVHRFSNATMPFFNVFKNSIYYWGYAALVAYFVNHPLYTEPTYGLMQVYIGGVIFLLAEHQNFVVHKYLRSLRRPGSTERRIPRQFWFTFVSCPNYFFEVVAWIGFTIMTQTLWGALFALTGCAQMMAWAGKKHKNYLREFDGRNGKQKYPPGRKRMFPFLW